MSSCGWFPLSHVEILAWVERHRDDLPRTLDEIAGIFSPGNKPV